MLVIPAIDLIDGKCVRLTKGDYSQMKEYSSDPLDVAARFSSAGYPLLHIVDLDGAKAGEPVNFPTIQKIAAKYAIQTGGGIRSKESAKKLLAAGVKRLILGTIAFKEPEILKELIQEFGAERIIVSVDAKNGKIKSEGWLEDSGTPIEDTLQKLKTAGVKYLIFTDIEQDGTLKGINPENIKPFLKHNFKLIVAGGVTTEKDLQILRSLNVYGAIVGKAFYEGTLKPSPQNNLAKRIIPCMDIKDGRVVKGINFVDLKDAGDPVELGKTYSEMGADELVFLDIMATVEKRDTLYKLVRKISANIVIPFTVGGGVKTIEDIRNLLNNGADKVSIGSEAVKNPDFVKEAAKTFGSQCIVISIDPKKDGDNWKVFVKGGREDSGVDAIEFAGQMESLGAGELLVNSLDRDGMKTGYDLPLLKKISAAINIPIIASSGAGKKEHFLEAFTEANVDAALAATLFHYGEIRIPELKSYLQSQNITIRT